MARRGRPHVPLVVSDAEREQLESWSRRRSSAQASVLRSRIVLEAATGPATWWWRPGLGSVRRWSARGARALWPSGWTAWSTSRALDITTGKVIGALHQRHRAIEFRKFLQTLDREVPQRLDVHVILDNASTHKTPAITKWLLAHPGSSCTSPRPAPRGSTSSSAGSPS